MERKEAVYKGLEFIPVFYIDKTLTSPDYFQISEFPLRLTAGKNLFKLRGHPTNLTTGGILNIEVLDYNGDTIYTEVVDYIDEDESRVIAIYIYEDTSPGDCTITLIAEASVIQDVPAPIEWQGKANVKWTRTVPINPMVSNNSEIIFETLPTVTISEQIGVQLDRQYATTQFPVYSTGTVNFTSLNGQPVAELTGGTFITDMNTGTITVSSPVNPTPTPAYPVVTTPYVSTIKKILTPTTALLDKEYTVYSSESIFPHIYSEFKNSSFSLTYEATPTYVETENSQSFAYIQLEGLEPATGDVSRTKVYTNNKGTVGTWELVNDVELEETEILVPSTSSLLPDISIGELKSQTTIDTYWEGHVYTGATETTTPTTSSQVTELDAAVKIVSGVDITPNNYVVTFQNKDAYKGVFIKDSAYKVTFDAYGIKQSADNFADPVIAVYMSGSAFDGDTTDLFNQDLPKQLGKRVGEIRMNGESQVFDNKTFSFNADGTGHGSIIFVIESGQWQLADAHVTTDNDVGYTPNYTRIKTFVETTHKIDNQISFKVEYYNVDGVASKQITYVYDKDWEGGNRYVDGDFSMLTGSLYVADSLNSGVAITGNAGTGFVRSLGYDGFAAGYPGFLLWSGSALQGSAGTKGGVAYSGVGLELYLDNSSYFRYSTADDEIYIATQNFFLGDPNTAFISGSDSNIEISASGFHLTPEGDVTASSFIAQQGGNTLFDSNNEFVDGKNIGRVVYFDRDEFTHTGNIGTSGGTPVTASVFETFILPGETRMQLSCMLEFRNSAGSNKSLQTAVYIQSASYTSSISDDTADHYDSWSNSTLLSTTTLLSVIGAGDTGSTGRTTELVSGNNLDNFQGTFVKVFLIAQHPGAGHLDSLLKMKNFVFRTSRTVGGATTPPLAPLPPG